MRSIIINLAALAAPLVSAHPRVLADTTLVELYTPTITTTNPFTAQQHGPEGSEIKLRCETFGPQCMTFPLDSLQNETISVRVYCAAALLKQKPQPVPESHTRHRPPHLKFVLVPSIMNPCPSGALCTVTIDESKRPPGAPPAPSPPPPGYDDGADIQSDAWFWFENEEGVVPALAGEDISAWSKLNWADTLAAIDFVEVEEEEEDEEDNQDGDDDKYDNSDDDQDGDVDGNKDGDDEADRDDDGDDKGGSYDGLAGLDIESDERPKLFVLARPRLPPIPKVPWFKFTCFLEDDTEPPPVGGH